eukprot:GHVT01062605.1.p2 GENE.GHVT01062605.1~~GHVT01062605.1.p2  ORF type:complete len:101 (-),score=14.24 GHVT01062605.1:566-868(-)
MPWPPAAPVPLAPTMLVPSRALARFGSSHFSEARDSRGGGDEKGLPSTPASRREKAEASQQATAIASMELKQIAGKACETLAGYVAKEKKGQKTRVERMP